MPMLDNIKSGFKNSIVTLLEIAHIRAEMARIEINEHKNQLIVILILLFLGFIFLFVAFISLLFGLEYYLLPEQKMSVFFAISGISFLLVLMFFLGILFSLRRQRRFMQHTLDELKLDIAAFKQALTFKQNGDL